MKIRKEVKEEFDLDYIRMFRKLSVREKLNYLEQINLLFNKLMPSKSKRVWQKLKSKGW